MATECKAVMSVHIWLQAVPSLREIRFEGKFSGDMQMAEDLIKLGDTRDLEAYLQDSADVRSLRQFRKEKVDAFAKSMLCGEMKAEMDVWNTCLTQVAQTVKTQFSLTSTQ